ncbi:FAD-dependent oxidoreductase [Paraeggerthella hongkongensis]|uniref:FAD-binding dehydrogenase n=1 Tax=Paraeggerthella hongkongensis TaxID=230658 RepID=A0A3N0BA06_9ACTN|nr:FAD-dependent oxidoreductase [Paraeggerthella hongkongensis]RNL44113.1 FAD-binding dehydrogenase [Paraeggerthella hongkongensis]
METNMNRRNFLKAAIASGAVIAAGGALAGCASNNTASSGTGTENVVGTAPVSFSDETDVLILGTGIAGMSAAMDPVEAGLKVMLVDKLERVGGESFIACGVMNVAGSKMQKDAGIPGDPEEKWQKFLPILEKKGETDDMDYKHDVYLCQTEWADRVAADYGAVFQPITDYMNTGAPTSMLLPGNGIGDMQAVLTPLQKGLEQKGATYKLNLRATNFIVDGEGAPIGVRFNDEKNGKTVDIKAKKIIVATGGFSCNQEMVATYLPSQSRLGPLTVNSMGEGHQMCKALGGVYTHMDMEANRMSDLAQVTVWGYFSPQVQVTPQGRRFIKEDQSHDSPDVAVKQGLGFWWTIFDNQAINSSQKWNVELNMKGNADRLVGPFNTLEELAAAMDVPASNLVETFARYDELVAAGEDADFGKKLFLQSLSAPYYAMKHFPYRYKTHGGMKITTNSQLADKDGNPIPNVYCCGSTVADSGSDLSPNAGSGLISGKAVVEALKA